MSTPTTATLISGLDRITSANLVGLSISQIRSDFRDVVNIPDGATATINGEVVDEYDTVSAGDQVVFSRPTGQKG